jgi:hypothetical protein
MTLTEARAADREGRIEAAATAYEQALASGDAPLDAVIDLAVLYWQSTEYGFWKSLGLSPAFVDKAAERFPQLLAQAEQLYPERPEPRFWKRYTAWADLGEPFEVTEAEALLRKHPDYLEPAMMLYSVSPGSEHEAQARELLRACRTAGTTRCRYMASVIEGALKRKTSRPFSR